MELKPSVFCKAKWSIPVTVCWKAIHCLAGMVGLNARHGLKSSLWLTIPLQGTRLRHQHASQAGPPHPTALITFFFACCFTSTETVRTIRVGEPRTPTSTFTRLLNSGISVAAPSVLIRHVPPMTYCETPPALNQFCFRGRWSQ